MTLTMGTGPFGSRPGVFNADLAAPDHLLYWEDSPRRVRVELSGHTVADSRRMKLLHESGRPPVYYFPVEDVHTELFQASSLRTQCPVKGEATHWSVNTGERAEPDVAWQYERPREQASWLAGHVAFYWDRMDAWYEEDEQVFFHPRDPYHRIDVRDSKQRIRVSLDGTLLADSTAAKVLFETGLPPRYYLPPEDLRADLLEPSDARTRCPYKGSARYWSVRTPRGLAPDLAWAYEEPLSDAEPVRGRRCFATERLELELD